MAGNTMSLVKRSTSLQPYRSMTQEGIEERARGEARSPRTGGCPPARTAPRSARPLATRRGSMAGETGAAQPAPRGTGLRQDAPLRSHPLLSPRPGLA